MKSSPTAMQTAMNSSSKLITGYAGPQPYRLQDPNGDRNDNHNIQDCLDAGSHGDKVIDQPQPDADHDQRNNDVD
jgi:hypothetical protein